MMAWLYRPPPATNLRLAHPDDSGGTVGQPIKILGTTLLGEVAIFDTDRSFGGMDGETYETLAEARAASTYPAELAERLMLSDGSIRLVYVYSNALSVSRAGGWADSSAEAVANEIANFFVVYTENKS